MASLFDSMMRMSFGLAETALRVADSSMKGLQSIVGGLTGQEPAKPAVDPPLNGPPTLDEATSDFANRLLRIAWTTPQTGDAFWGAGRELLDSINKSFSGLDLGDPRVLMALPLQLPLSFGTLMSQTGLRGLYASSVIGTDEAGQLASYMLDSFTDIDVFVSLKYGEQLKRLKELAGKSPEDADLRLKLGKTYTKLGMYTEAIEQFGLAAQNSRLRADALRLSLIAAYRGGELQQAIRDGVESLRLLPTDNRTRFWLFLAAQKLGGYPPEVPEECRMEVKAGRHPTTLEYEDVAARIGLDKTAAGRGTAVFDMNGDGYLDVVISSAHGGVSLHRNNGDGTFTDVSVGSGLDECTNAFIVTVGDYNNDGLDDLYITRLGFYHGECVLYRNNGDGTFTDVTKEAGVGCWGPNFAAHWVDYDCDGNLDLFVASNLAGLFDRKTPNRLFHNNGDGTFTEVSEKVGLNTPYPTIGGAWGDYNNDGYPDVFFSSSLGRGQLYRNNGDGTFTEVTAEAGLGEICFGSATFWVDYDNDGWLDLVQFIWSPEEHVLHTLLNGDGAPTGLPMRIYRNNRDGTFTKLDQEIGLTGCWGTMSGNAGDIDNDGHVDLLLGNGDPHMDRTEPSILLKNDGAGRFHNISFTAGLPFTGKGHGANLADLMGDGRLCVIMNSGGAYPADLLTTSVFRPKTLPGNYLNVRLTGTKSNRNAIGARVKLEHSGRAQHRLVGGGSGFGSLPYEQHFGLGSETKVDAIEIWWPSGLRQRIENLPHNSTIRITEGRDAWVEVYAKKQVQ